MLAGTLRRSSLIVKLRLDEQFVKSLLEYQTTVASDEACNIKLLALVSRLGDLKSHTFKHASVRNLRDESH